MNKFFRTVSLLAALCISATLFAGCRDEKEIADKLTLINEGCSKAISDESGEMLIYKTVRLQKDIEDVLESATEETFIVFTNNNGNPDFDLTTDRVVTQSGETSKYQFVKDGDKMLELFDEQGSFVNEAPEIFGEFHADFEASDVKSVEITQKEKGFKEYKLIMTGAYADRFDGEADGLVKDCTAVAYCYYIDNYKNLSNIRREYVYTVTYDGESQTMIEFVDAKID